jgi:rubrerythrin
MSQLFFNEVEAAKIAQNMEKNGLAFYRKAAAKAKDVAVRDLFLKLAGDEKGHLARFEELEETLQAARRDQAGYADDTEIAAYIDRLLQTQVFGDAGDVARLAEQAADDVEALGVGMKAERDSIVFYQEMLDFVDSKVAKTAFASILKEERQHLRLLGELSEDCAA